MKKICGVLLLLFSAHSFAAGPYDGIWSINPYGYATVSERDGILVAVVLYNPDYGGNWIAFQGPRTNNTARISLIVGIGESVYDVVADSDTTIRLTQISCSTPLLSGYYCPFPDGFTLTANRIW